MSRLTDTQQQAAKSIFCSRNGGSFKKHHRQCLSKLVAHESESFLPSSALDLDKALLPLEPPSERFPGMNKAIIRNDSATQEGWDQNQPNKKRKLQNSEGFGIFTSNNSYQSPYIDNTETEIHSIGLCPQNDYNIRIFSNHDVSVPLKKTVPQSSPKNIKLKFEDFLDVNKEPVRPHADENLISLVREVMRTTNRNQKIVAMEIGVSQTTMSRYMQSERKSKGWNRIERKLKLWITNLEVKMPTPRKLVVPERNHSADAESKKGAYEHGRPINMRDSCDCFECAIEKQKSNSFTSQYSNPSIEQQLPAAYQTKRLQYSQKSYVDVQPHSSEYGLYDQSTVLFPHPFASPSNRDIADQPQSSFWPPLNLILSFDHTLLLDPNL